MMLAANNPILMRAYHPQIAAAQKEAPRSRFTPTTGFAGWQTSISWLLKGYLPDNSFGVVYGPSGSFKSFAVLDWACCIALGEPWLGCRVKPGRVVYVAAEGASGLRKRIKGWCDAYNFGDNIDNLQVVGCPVDLHDREQVEEFVEEIKSDDDPVKLVVIDTLARCFGGEDENSASAMGAAITACDEIKIHTGACVLAVHHSGKEADKGARGSSALRAACDFEIAIKRAGCGLGYELITTKQKDSEQLPSVVIPLEVRDLGILDEDGEPITTLVRSRHVSSLKACKAKPDTQTSELQDLILDELSDCDDGMPWPDLRDTIAHRLGVDRNSSKQKVAMNRAMNELLQRKTITGSVSGKENIRLA